jgi:hypothetical protein
MTADEFVDALKTQTSDAAIFGTISNLERPPGRRPTERDVVLSNWYHNLPEDDQRMLKAAITEAAELAVFSFLTILDGVSTIENGPDKGNLYLIYDKESQEILLNDPSREYLHDAFNYRCQTSEPLTPELPDGRVYEVGPASSLRAR